MSAAWGRTFRDVASDALLATSVRFARQQPEGTRNTLLIMQPDHFGDILLSQPAVQLLREAFPNHQIVAIVGPWSFEIARLTWPVDRIETLAFPGFVRDSRLNPVTTFTRVTDAAQVVAGYHAELAVILRPDDRWSAAVANAANVPSIVTGDSSRASGYATTIASTTRVRHRAAKALLIAATAAGNPMLEGTPEAFPTRIDRDWLPSIDPPDIPDRPFVVLHPGAGAEIKHWPAHRWQAIVREIERCGLQVVVTGSSSEAALVGEIVAESSAMNKAGQTDVRQLANLLAGARLAIGTDNGPMHLAVALGTPSVGLYGPSNPAEFGPWGDHAGHRVIHAGLRCPRCTDLSPDRPEGCGCMMAISVGQVMSTISEMLD
jgi:heptosyltransferase-3